MDESEKVLWTALQRKNDNKWELVGFADNEPDIIIRTGKVSNDMTVIMKMAAYMNHDRYSGDDIPKTILEDLDYIKNKKKKIKKGKSI